MYVQQLVERLHGVLRPFLLRRLKSEVEKQVCGRVRGGWQGHMQPCALKWDMKGQG